MLGVQSADLRAVDASPRRLREMAQGWSQRPNFVPIRLNELFNGLQVEHTDDYVLAMVGGLGGRHEQEVRLFMLRHDHALRDQVFWRVFEVEGGGEISLANIDKFSREEFNWHNTVVLLANEGTLDRGRVLRGCLEALNRDFSAYRAGWFSRVYASLAPTPETAADQPLLRLCLGSSITATVSLGVKQLEVLHKHGLLDAAPFVQACGGAGPKAAALSVLRMLEALGARVAVESDAVAQALALGLGHPHADVQRAAVKALARLGREDLAHQQRDALAPAVAAMLSDAGAGSAAGKGWRRAAKPAFVRRASRLAAARAAAPLDRRGRPGTLCRAAGSARRRAGVRAGAGLAGDVRAGGGHDRAPGEAGALPGRARRAALRGGAAAGGA